MEKISLLFTGVGQLRFLNSIRGRLRDGLSVKNAEFSERKRLFPLTYPRPNKKEARIDQRNDNRDLIKDLSWIEVLFGLIFKCKATFDWMPIFGDYSVGNQVFSR